MHALSDTKIFVIYLSMYMCDAHVHALSDTYIFVIYLYTVYHEYLGSFAKETYNLIDATNIYLYTYGKQIHIRGISIYICMHL